MSAKQLADAQRRADAAHVQLGHRAGGPRRTQRDLGGRQLITYL